MKHDTIFKCLALITMTLCSVEAVAYYDEKEKEACRHPKVQELTLQEYQAPENKEVPAETEFSFVVSAWADPKKIKLDGKGVQVPFTVESNETFHKVKAKLPPELTGKFIRLSARIPAVLGCYTTVGWLIKVADKPKAVEAPKSSATIVPESATPDAKTVPSGETTPPSAVTSTPQKLAPAAKNAVTSPTPTDKTNVAP